MTDKKESKMTLEEALDVYANTKINLFPEED